MWSDEYRRQSFCRQIANHPARKTRDDRRLCNMEMVRNSDAPNVRRNLGPTYWFAQAWHASPVRVFRWVTFKHRESVFLYRVSFQYSINQGLSMDSAIVWYGALRNGRNGIAARRPNYTYIRDPDFIINLGRWMIKPVSVVQW